MTLLERITELARSKNISIRQLERECQIGNGVIDNWSKSYPRSDKLLNVANYLHVSIEYLLTGKEKESLTSKEQELLSYFRQLPESEQLRELGRLEARAEMFKGKLSESKIG